MNRVEEEVDENPNYDALDYEGWHHHHHHHNDHLKIMKTVFIAENFDDNESIREDSEQSKEMSTREVKAEVL